MTELHNIYNNPPKKTNFIALYSDGSGAELFCRLPGDQYSNADGGIVIDAEELQEWLEDSGFMYWVSLPDDFQFFFMGGA